MTAPASTKIFEMLADELKDFLKTTVDAETVERIVDERIAKAKLPRPIEVRMGETVIGKLDERSHYLFDRLMDLVNEGHSNILMVGPAGSGKTTLAKSLAKGLGLDFGFLSLSAGISETHLFGRVLPQKDGSWEYRPSRFVEIYERGGVFLLDEIDAADPNVMVAINAALANGMLANPNGQLHERHERTYILAAANTWGRGGDHQYVGRNALDTDADERLPSTSRQEIPAATTTPLAAWITRSTSRPFA